VCGANYFTSRIDKAGNIYSAVPHIFRVVLLLLRQRRSSPGSSLCTAIKYLQRATRGAARAAWAPRSSTRDAQRANGLGTASNDLRRITSVAAGSDLRRITSVAAGSDLGTTINYLRGAAGNGLGTSMKYLQRTTSCPRATAWADAGDYWFSPSPQAPRIHLFLCVRLASFANKQSITKKSS
jgi:hypothetical protein